MFALFRPRVLLSIACWYDQCNNDHSSYQFGLIFVLVFVRWIYWRLDMEKEIHQRADWFVRKTKHWLVKKLLPMSTAERIAFLQEIYTFRAQDFYFYLQSEFPALSDKA